MLELITISFTPAVLPLTLLLIAMVCYWGLVIVGFLGIDVLDFDADVDADVDVDVDMDADAGHGGASGMVGAILSFVNADRVPVAVVLSFLILALWVGSVLGNHFFNGSGSLLIGMILFLPVLFVAIFVTKAITAPMAKVFQTASTKSERHEDLLGRSAILLSPVSGDRLGQAELASSTGGEHRLNVRAHEGLELERGSEVVLVDYDPEKHYFVVKPLPQIEEGT